MAFPLKIFRQPKFLAWKGHKSTFKSGGKNSERPKDIEDDGQLEEVGEVMEGCQNFLRYFQSSSNLYVSMPTENNGNIPSNYAGTWMKPLKHQDVTFIEYGMRTETMTSLAFRSACSQPARN